ncbi:MAG: O-antigen ligase family protein [Gammaproteobacteria bacterium]|nr:O-antigen ligase family protein [Gammaproteobacteria bacterium]
MTQSQFQSDYRVSPISLLVLCLAVIQGTSTTLTLAYHFSLAFEPVVNALWALTYLLSTVALFATFGVNWVTWVVRYRLLLTLLIVGAFFSSFWSVDNGLSLERSVHLVGSTLIALCIGFTVPLARILRITSWILLMLLIASVAMVFLYPALGIEQYEGKNVWRGVMTSKNTLGFWSTVACLLFVTQSARQQSFLVTVGWLAAAALAVIVLYFTVSATSVLSLFVAGLMTGYLWAAFRFRLSFVPMFVLGVMVTGIAALAFIQIDTAEMIGRSNDLTGRADVWRQTWELVLAKPLTGYGYGALWYPTAESMWIQRSLLDFSWVVFHAHNGFLQLASEIGLPLTFVALLMILQQLIETVFCQYQRQQPGVLFVLGFLVALLVSNYAEARMLVNRELYWIFFIALPISMLQQITVIATDTAFNPVPTPLKERKFKKSPTLAADRQTRKELKARLRSRREGRIIEATATPIPTVNDSNSTPSNSQQLETDTNRLEQKLIRRRKKSK